MKRFWVILGALAMVCALNTVAGAAVLAKKDIPWLDQTRTVLWQTKDKTAITNSGTPLDTLSSFSLLGCAEPTSGNPEASNVDSTVIAQVVFITDSTVAVTNDLTFATYTIEVSEDGFNWQAVNTIQNATTSGDKMWTIPLWIRKSEGFGAAGVKHNPYFARQIRVRITAATGNQHAVRAQLWYWAE